MTFDSTGIMASNIGIVYNLHNKLWFLYIKKQRISLQNLVKRKVNANMCKHQASRVSSW